MRRGKSFNSQLERQFADNGRKFGQQLGRSNFHVDEAWKQRQVCRDINWKNDNHFLACPRFHGYLYYSVALKTMPASAFSTNWNRLAIISLFLGYGNLQYGGLEWSGSFKIRYEVYFNRMTCS